MAAQEGGQGLQADRRADDERAEAKLISHLKRKRCQRCAGGKEVQEDGREPGKGRESPIREGDI